MVVKHRLLGLLWVVLDIPPFVGRFQSLEDCSYFVNNEVRLHVYIYVTYLMFTAHHGELINID